MTNTRSGTNASSVGSAWVAVQAVVNRVNAAGGICGRLLQVRTIDDPSGPRRWPRFDGTFAELVGPAQPGFDRHIGDGSVDRAEVPAVGTDGLSPLQFRSSWVWPVGTSAASMARIAVEHAYRTVGARTFALVYDPRAEFGDAEAVVRAQLATLPDASLLAVERFEGQPSGEANRRCAQDACDAVVLAMHSGIGEDWLRGGGARGRLHTAALRFVPRPRGSCELLCPSALHVWASFTPPIEPFLQEPDVARYVEHVRAVDERVDALNPFLESTYVGALAFVEALKRVGPNLTRERLREVLDDMHFESDLVGELDWQWGGNRTARLLRSGTTVEDAGTGWVRDPAD